MGKRVKAARVVRHAVADGLARLVDIAPTQLVLFGDEADDWSMVGDDLRAAMDRVADAEAQTPANPAAADDEFDEAEA